MSGSAAEPRLNPIQPQGSEEVACSAKNGHYTVLTVYPLLRPVGLLEKRTMTATFLNFFLHPTSSAPSLPMSTSTARQPSIDAQKNADLWS